MRSFLFTLLIIMTHATLASGQSIANGELPSRDDGTAGQYCGPCCVHYLLKVFGRTYDLDELIREIQPPDSKSGATLDSLSKALSQRGVYTLPVAVRRTSDVELTSPYPMILHLSARGAKDAHYVVWLPSAATDVTTIWDPSVGTVTETTWDAYSPQLSGAMLLTSPDPLNSPRFAIRSRANPRMLWTSAGFAVTALLLVAYCFARRYSPLPASPR
jgi:ABC-type bacteriocin/lantibiotic exporter with double-glycine peptidase domain